MIFYSTSFQGHASLVLSNKRFFNAFNTLLYQDIRLDNPRQLVQLYRNTSSKRKLRDTLKHVLGGDVFSLVKWEELKTRLLPPVYLARILNETSSLREFEFNPSNRSGTSHWEFEGRFVPELVSWASKASFLPKLASLRFPQRAAVSPLLQGRPLARITTSCVLFQPKTNMGYCVSELTPESAALELRITEHGGDSASQVGKTIQGFVRSCSPLTTVKHVQILLRFFLGEITEDTCIRNIFAWAQTVLTLSGCSHLKTLLVYFDPPLMPEPLDEQHSTLEGLKKLMPSLVFVVLGSPDVEWRRRIPEPLSALSARKSSIPEWTPRPNYGTEVLKWWLRAFQLTVSGAEEDIQRIASQLWATMRERWDDAYVPSVDAIQAQLSAVSND